MLCASHVLQVTRLMRIGFAWLTTPEVKPETDDLNLLLHTLETVLSPALWRREPALFGALTARAVQLGVFQAFGSAAFPLCLESALVPPDPLRAGLRLLRWILQGMASPLSAGAYGPPALPWAGLLGLHILSLPHVLAVPCPVTAALCGADAAFPTLPDLLAMVLPGLLTALQATQTSALPGPATRPYWLHANLLQCAARLTPPQAAPRGPAALTACLQCLEALTAALSIPKLLELMRQPASAQQPQVRALMDPQLLQVSVCRHGNRRLLRGWARQYWGRGGCEATKSLCIFHQPRISDSFYEFDFPPDGKCSDLVCGWVCGWVGPPIPGSHANPPPPS